MKPFFVAIACATLSASTTIAASTKSVETITASVELSRTRSTPMTCRYTLILPDNFNKLERYPVLVALPPGDQSARMVDAGLTYWEAEGNRRGWVIVAPEAPKDLDGNPIRNGLAGHGAGIVSHIIEDLKTKSVQIARPSEYSDPSDEETEDASDGRPPQRFTPTGGGNRDKDDNRPNRARDAARVYLAGISNGGRSAFSAALTMPEQVAGILVAPGMADRGDMRKLEDLAGIHIAMYVGAEDRQWVQGTTATKRRLLALDWADAELPLAKDAPLPKDAEGEDDAHAYVSVKTMPNQGHLVRVDPAELFDTLDAWRALDARASR